MIQGRRDMHARSALELPASGLLRCLALARRYGHPPSAWVQAGPDQASSVTPSNLTASFGGIASSANSTPIRSRTKLSLVATVRAHMRALELMPGHAGPLRAQKERAHANSACPAVRVCSDSLVHVQTSVVRHGPPCSSPSLVRSPSRHGRACKDLLGMFSSLI